MEQVRLGHTGLKVSRICLGTMTYGDPKWRDWVLDEAGQPPLHQARPGSGDQFLRHRRHLFQRRLGRGGGAGAEGFRRQARRLCAGDQGVLPGRWPPWRAVAQAHPARHRRFPAAAGHRLCRSLPDPPLRQSHADRGNHRGAARCGEGGQGALYRRLVHACLAVRQISFDRRENGHDEIRLHAEFLQSGVPGGGARDAAACAATPASA